MKCLDIKNIVFVGNARDYHAIDWYRTVKKVCPAYKVFFLTDLIESESHTRLLHPTDHIHHLFNIDKFLFRNQSKLGNKWRNFIKLFFFPLQIILLKKFSKKYPNSVFHAHTMYYMFLCWAAKIQFIGTPQGSEILVRPKKSKFYRYFAVKSLLAATHITVDSVNLQKNIFQLCGQKSLLIQNGIDVSAISIHVKNSNERQSIVSIRGLYPIYRIDEIFKAADRCESRPALTLIYPFWEDSYRDFIIKKTAKNDMILGRLTQNEMYKLLSCSKLVISIPESDSSPRSVYEAIFCGACVAVTYNPWIDSLPECMRSRLFIIDLKDPSWLQKSIQHAELITRQFYYPSETALELFDQNKSMKKLSDLLYQT